MHRKGFTLIELIVVIAIIAILAAIIAPNAFKAVEKAKISGAIEDFRSIKTGAMSFYSDAGTWPLTCATPALCAGSGGGFVSAPVPAVTGWDGPYLEKWPAASKWGGQYTWGNVAAGMQFNAAVPPGGTGERWVTITQVPSTAAVKIDAQMDGTIAAGNGDVRYPAGSPVSVQIVVSRDGPVS
ncbi:MAG: prepilin-type N-terminal cleavage/methylation domain-containing protein [Candidatus Omnitrophica bacterium]|nr:prepilin-type N-terminal cleavage/methylation domain-containing protein [Candidatus Omnitrophota bacterium]